MIVRAEHNDNFTVMSNYHLRDKKLSLKAKGLLSWALSCSDDWIFSTAGMVENTKESRDAIRSAILELEEQGYLRREPIKEGGKFKGTEFIFYEIPQTEKPQTENPTTVPQTEKPYTENPPLINTNIKNTKESKKERKKEDKAEAPKLDSYEEIVSYLVDDPQVKGELLQYIFSRCGKGDYLRNVQVQALIKQLLEITSDPKEQIKIIDQSLAGGYKSFFALKSNKKGNSEKKEKAKAVSKPVSEADKWREQNLPQIKRDSKEYERLLAEGMTEKEISEKYMIVF